MALLDFIGQAGQTQEGFSKRWMRWMGEVTELKFKGPADEITTKYDNLKGGAGVAGYEEVTLDVAGGYGVAIARKADDTEPTIIYELLSNDVSVPIYNSPYFQDKLLADDIANVFIIYDDPAKAGWTYDELNKGNQTPADGGVAYFPIKSWTDEMKELYAMLTAGFHEYIDTAYVLRSTQITNQRTALKASHDNVGEVVTPPAASSVNALIGDLPAGEWLKRPPNVTMYGIGRWQIIQEYWLATKWLAGVYPGGTLAPKLGNKVVLVK